MSHTLGDTNQEVLSNIQGLVPGQNRGHGLLNMNLHNVM